MSTSASIRSAHVRSRDKIAGATRNTSRQLSISPNLQPPVLITDRQLMTILYLEIREKKGYSMPLKAESAQKMINASHAKARELGIAVSTAIVASDGTLFAFGRMEGARLLSINVSQAKAYTGALLQRDGPELLKLPPTLVSNLSIVQGRGLMPMESVTTLRDADDVVAAIGCSGGTDEQDAQCAHAAREVYAT
jgi:uncharacterized protein GlcG (DUF336 family)